MIKLCYKGTRHGLQIGDLYKTLYDDKSEDLGDKLEKNWQRECAKAKEKHKKPSLFTALTKTFFWQYMIWGFVLFFQSIFLR